MIFPTKAMKSVIAGLVGSCAALGLIASPAICAQTSVSAPAAFKPATLEEFWRKPQMLRPKISKSGRYIAALAPAKGRMNLVVIDLTTRKGEVLTSYESFDILSMEWIGDERIVYSLGSLNSPTGAGQFDGGGLFVVSRDGKQGKQLAGTVRDARAKGNLVYRGLSFFRAIPGNTDEIIASGNLTAAESQDLYRVDLNSGRASLLTAGRPATGTSNWIMDSKLVPRAVLSRQKGTLTVVSHYRAGADSPWQEIGRYDALKGNRLLPLAFESDDKTLQVASNEGRDTMAVFRFDPNTKKLGEMIAAHPKYDMGADFSGDDVPGVIEDPDSGKIVGYQVEGDKLESVWIDERYARVQKAMDGALPKSVNVLSSTPDRKKWMVTSYSDISSARFYFFDEDKKTLEEIGGAKPWLDGKLVEQKPFRFTTRDGLEIPGYVFLPPGYKPGTKLPTILHIHGGPFARADTFGGGFGYAEGQIFASRGYAVIVPNFRVSTGMGTKIFTAGIGTVGRQMSDDHEDAVQWAIDQGYTDAKRVCISGASYGGFAALHALIKRPEMFACSIAGLAVTDYKYQLTTPDGDTSANEENVDYWKGILGTTDLDSKLVRDISPIFHAEKIKAPVFLYAGEDDIRVPIDQIDRMSKALTRAGNPPKAYVVKKNEGHGFGKTENNVDLYTQMLKFVETSIGKP
jgi:dipeptidyl aminopeptidase/acylaminoacyl peptidase